jgi:hypothetical protein
VAERVILVCNMEPCPTPEDDVKRVSITVDRSSTETDLCRFHREPVDEIRRRANRKRGRGRQIEVKVKNPEDIQRRSPRRT